MVEKTKNRGPKRKPIILVVEDNPDSMALIDEILEDEGFKVLKATMAEDGIALLKETRTNLIIMDISLPKMSGLEASKIIKADETTKGHPHYCFNRLRHGVRQR